MKKAKKAATSGGAKKAKPGAKEGKPRAGKVAAGSRKVASREGKSTTTPRRSPAAPHQDGAWADVFAPRKAGERRYWLAKSEPSVFSFDDLLKTKRQTTHWDGIRNYAARNFLRDGMKNGDLVFFYHSLAGAQEIAGVCEVVREGYPDHTAFDKDHHGYDEKSELASPTWFMVDLRVVEKWDPGVPLSAIKQEPRLANMALLRIGRLSLTPVTAEEWKIIYGLR